MKKEQSVQGVVVGQVDSTVKRMKLDTYLMPLTKKLIQMDQGSVNKCKSSNFKLSES